MKCIIALFLVLLTTVTGSRSRGSAKSPVEKVVDLLKDLKNKVEQDGESEQMTYDKYACFCDNALKGKADAIDQAKADTRSVGQEILKLRGQIATLTMEIEELSVKIKENVQMQEEATALREKENSEFQAETSEEKLALVALQQATQVLMGATARAALLQSGASARASAVKMVLAALPAKAALSTKQLSMLSEFAGAHNGYAPQSETIQGILQDMYQNFASDLESAMAQEAKAAREYELFIEIKQKELKELQSIKAEKEEQKASAEQQLAEATSLYDETENQMKADIAYFDVTKEGCVAKYDEWTERSKLREAELRGIDQAIEILSSDEARDLFNSAIKPGKETMFLQLSSDDSVSAPVARAYELLKAQATGAHSFRLAQLAVHVREAKVGHFDEVIGAIDKMIAALKEEGLADIDKRDQCKDQYQKIEATSKDLTWKIANNQAKIDKLASIIQKREEEKVQTIEAIKSVEEQMKTMTAERKEENEQFLEAKKEDEAAIKLLTMATEALTKYYKENDVKLGPIQGSVKGLELRQSPEFAVSKYQAPEAKFSTKDSRGGQSKDIISMMTMITEDLQDEIKNAMKAEEEAQLQYEHAMAAAEHLKMELIVKKLSLEDAIAKRTIERAEEETTMNFNKNELKDEVEYKAKIKPDCDWIIGAFEKRAKHRAAEMAGLTGAKDYLAGANEAALLQGKKARVEDKFDDNALAKVRFLALSSH